MSEGDTSPACSPHRNLSTQILVVGSFDGLHPGHSKMLEVVKLLIQAVRAKRSKPVVEIIVPDDFRLKTVCEQVQFTALERQNLADNFFKFPFQNTRIWDSCVSAEVLNQAFPNIGAVIGLEGDVFVQQIAEVSEKLPLLVSPVLDLGVTLLQRHTTMRPPQSTIVEFSGSLETTDSTPSHHPDQVLATEDFED